jgi:hypothetical protein
MRSVWWIPLFAAALGGCGNHHIGAGGAVPNLGTLTVYRIQSGGVSVISPGTQAGFSITATAGSGGSSYRMVWTGDASVSRSYHEFWGSVYTPGRFLELTPGCAASSPCPLESDDFVSGIAATTGGERIDFDTFTTSGIDGFDFVVDTEPAIFDLFIDGAQYPDLVFFPATDSGGAVSSVGVFPFGLTTQ